MRKIVLIFLIGLTFLSASRIKHKSYICLVMLKEYGVVKLYRSGESKFSTEAKLQYFLNLGNSISK